MIENEKKQISEYDQEILQSKAADKPVASWGEATQLKIAIWNCYRI